ncbi:MAG: hypothetical protein F4X82_01235 [Candidatus Spechtbacteria bacterium SB0662_bin_43]|uniref:Uncharacterized protein n=1 Tax=Candidatus Spechtbacteria bacterium SB0662_bin_43 TaxID=2604897 RepID=A0A845DAQ3_9BACT|nr:hypothetical protein [Candidatus Spechtbacteria bacterium SB0662_bin_43]
MKKTEFEYKYVKKCADCKTMFSSRSIHLVDRFKNVSQVYVECKKCKKSVLVYIVKSEGLFVTQIDVPTDMKKEDIIRFQNMSPVSEDEVLAFRKWIKKSAV